MLPLRRNRGSNRVQTVVREDEAACGARNQSGAQQESGVHPQEVRKDLLQLDGEHKGLVHFPSAVVGTPHTRVLLRRLRRNRGVEDRARTLPQVRRAYASGRGRSGHLVLFRALAVQHAGISAQEQEPFVFLSDERARHRLRHHFLLGGEDDIQRHRDDERTSVLGSAHSRHSTRCRGQEDVQESRQRHRPVGDNRPLRRGRAALLPRDGHCPRQRHALYGRED